MRSPDEIAELVAKAIEDRADEMVSYWGSTGIPARDAIRAEISGEFEKLSQDIRKALREE